MSIQQLTSSEAFESTIAKGIALVDFNAPWCAPCRMQEPILQSLSVQYQGKATIASLDIDRNREIAIRMGVQSIPTLVVFRDNHEIRRFVGIQPESILAEALEACTHGEETQT
jgi:thioredoxin 1